MLLISLLINTISGYAQSLCPTSPATETGGFTVPAQVCAGKPIAITGERTGLGNIRYYYNYDGNSIPSNANASSSLTTTYANPGSYTILQIAAVSGNNAVACRVVEVVPVKPVSFSTSVCSNRLVTLTYTLDNETIRYNLLTISWGDGTSTPVNLNNATRTGTITHTYLGTATNYGIQVASTYTNANLCTIGSPIQNVRVLNTSAVDPNILTLTSDATKATINYQGPDGFGLELYQKDAGGNYVPTGLSGTSGGFFTIPASPASVNCFQIVAKDVCGGSERRSAEVCSLVLTVKPEDRQNVANWQPYAGVGGKLDQYRVFRNGGAPAFSARAPSLPTTFTDKADITCSKSYCYVLEATIQNTTTSPTTIRSMSTCVTGFDNGSVVSPTSAYVSVQPNGVNVQSTLPTVGVPPGYTLVVTRSDGGGSAFTPLGTSNDRSYLDATAQTNSQSYCYQTAIRNGCGVLSRPTLPACTILLTRAANGSLTWTSASPYANESPQTYQVIFIDPATGASDKNQLGNVTTFRPDPDSQITQYQIAAINNAGVESYSNPLEVELGVKVFLPNAFTPNGDGQNQSFMAKGGLSFWDTFDLTIYSRWGDVVYNTTDKSSTGWNGEVNGAPAPSGYYGYRVRVTDMAGKAFERTGQVLLIR